MARLQPTSNPVFVQFGEFELDEANASLLRRGKPVALAPTPFTLLCALVNRPATLFTKHALLDEVWSHQFVTDSVLKTAISDLRTALDDAARQPRFIETVPRRGYRFIAHPTARADTGLAPGTPHTAAPVRSSDAWFIGRCSAAGFRFGLHRKAGTALERERAAGLPVAAAELAMHFERAREPMSALRYYAEAA